MKPNAAYEAAIKAQDRAERRKGIAGRLALVAVVVGTAAMRIVPWTIIGWYSLWAIPRFGWVLSLGVIFIVDVTFVLTALWLNPHKKEGRG